MSSAVHVIALRDKAIRDFHSHAVAGYRVHCTCGHVAASLTLAGANRRHDDHILAAMRDDRAAGKRGGDAA